MDKYIFDKKLGRNRRILYENGTAFSTKMLLDDISDLKTHINSSLPGAIIVDGWLGKGKTTCAVQLMKQYSGACFDYEKQIGQGGVDFQNKFDTVIRSKLDGAIYDEAGDLDSRRSLTQFNNQINRFMDMSRVYKKLIVLCLPKFSVLDSRVYDKGIIQFLVHIVYRRSTYAHFYVYDFNQILWLKKRMQDLVNPMMAYSLVQPTYYGEVLNLPPDEELKLEKVTKESKDAFRMEVLTTSQGIMTTDELGRKLGRTRQWVNLKLKQAKIKPVKLVGNRRYYDDVVLNRLERVMK